MSQPRDRQSNNPGKKSNASSTNVGRYTTTGSRPAGNRPTGSKPNHPVRSKSETERMKAKLAREKKAREAEERARNQRLMLLYSAITIFVILFLWICIANMTSDKDKLRKNGISAYNKYNYEEAISLFQQALDEHQWFTKKMDLDIQMYMADSYMRLCDYNQAKNTFIRIRSINNGAIDSDLLENSIHLADAMIQVDQGNYQTAIYYLEDAVANGNVAMNLYLGGCYGKDGNFNKMIECYEAYTAKYNMNSYIAAQLSTYYLEQEQYAMAKTYIDSGLVVEDHTYLEQVLYNEVAYYELTSDFETAFNKIQSFVAAYPENETGKKEYDYLYSRMKEAADQEKPEEQEAAISESY